LLGGHAPWSVLGDEFLSVGGPLSPLGWLGGPVFIALASTPAFLLVRRRSLDARHTSSFGPADTAGAAMTLLLVGMVTYLAVALSPFEMPLVILIPTLGPLVAFGLLVGTAKGWWPWASIAVGILMLHAHSWSPTLFWPRFTAAFLVSLWPVIARWIDMATARPTSTLVALNGLNVVDAVLTQMAVIGGVATELNPLVVGAGMIAKVLVVAAASLLIYRVKPKLLIWPALAFVGVTLWHLIGMVVNA
jgi:hypothetical protein